MLECVALGSLNGALLMGFCLSWQPGMIAASAILGGTYGALYSQALRYFITKIEKAGEGESAALASLPSDSKYVDS